MSTRSFEVELVHGRVIPKGTDVLPEKATALLTILRKHEPRQDFFTPDPELQKVIFYEDPSLPLEPEDWLEAFE